MERSKLLMIVKDLFRVNLTLIIIDIIELGVVRVKCAILLNRIGDRRVPKEATKRSQITPLESPHIELKIRVSGAVRDHLGESISIRIGVGI